MNRIKKENPVYSVSILGSGHRFGRHAINDVAISTKPVETGSLVLA